MRSHAAAIARPLVPALVAAYPAVFISAANNDEVAGVDAAIAIAFYMALGVLVHAAIRLVAPRRIHSVTVAVIAALLAAMLFPVALVMQRHPIVRFGGGETPFLASIALVFVAIALTVWHHWRVGGSRPGVFRGVAVGVLAIYATILASLIPVWRERARIERTLAGSRLQSPIRTVGTAPRERPDVFVFLLDTYASPRVLEASYGFRDEAFLDSLARLGFTIPSVARANYSITSHALAAMSNVDYLDELDALFDGKTRTIWPLYHLTHHDRTTAFLESRGYRTFVVPSIGWEGTRVHQRARVHLGTSLWARVRGAISRTQVLELAWRHTLAGKLIPAWSPLPSQARVSLDAFSGTIELLDEPSPKYVLAHSMVAHFPFMVDARCRVLPDSVAASEETLEGRAAYIDGIRCTNRQVLSTVTEILRRSRQPPIIILQSDHGPRRMGTPWEGRAEEITAPQAIERLEVLGAYHLPGAPRLLGDTVTPVNAMRAGLSHYHGADLPALPDRSMHTTVDRRYHFAVVPDSVFDRSLSPELAVGPDTGVGVPLHP